MRRCVRARTVQDRGWAEALLRGHWGGTVIASRGRMHDALALPALVVEDDRGGRGLLTYRVEAAACEIVTLDAVPPRRGLGTALVEAIADQAVRAGCRRLWLITTNDNVDALRFYQRRGFELAAVHRGAVTRSRALKPTIPEIGAYGIPLRDEIELERPLAARR